MKRWFCPAPFLPAQVLHGLKIILTLSYLLLAYLIFVFIVRTALRKLFEDSSSSSSRYLSTTVKSCSEDIDESIKKNGVVPKIVRRPFRRPNFDKADNVLIGMGSSNMNSKQKNNDLYYRIFDSIAKNAKTMGLQWMNKLSELKDVMYPPYHKKRQSNQSGKIIEILTCRRNMWCETNSVFSNFSTLPKILPRIDRIKDSHQSGRVKGKTHSKQVHSLENFDKDQTARKSSIPRHCVQDLHGKSSEMKSNRNQSTWGSNNHSLKKIVQKKDSWYSTADVAQNGQKDMRRQNFQRPHMSNCWLSKEVRRSTTDFGQDECQLKVRKLNFKFSSKPKYPRISKEIVHKTKGKCFSADGYRRHKVNRGKGNQTSLLTFNAQYSRLTTPNEAERPRKDQRRRQRSSARSRSSTPKLKIEFSMNKRSSAKCKTSGKSCSRIDQRPRENTKKKQSQQTRLNMSGQKMKRNMSSQYLTPCSWSATSGGCEFEREWLGLNNKI